MSTSKTFTCFALPNTKGAKPKKVTLSPKQFAETFRTPKKRERVRKGITVRVRNEGKLTRYYSADSRRAQAA